MIAPHVLPVIQGTPVVVITTPSEAVNPDLAILTGRTDLPPSVSVRRKRALTVVVNVTYSYHFRVFPCGSVVQVNSNTRRWRRELTFTPFNTPETPVDPGPQTVSVDLNQQFTPGRQYCNYLVVTGNNGSITWNGDTQTFFYPSAGRPYTLNTVLVDNPPQKATFSAYVTYEAGDG